jgi:hypothetical protein
MILQLNPQIPVYIVDKGEGYALALVDYSQDHSLMWLVAMNDTGEMWIVPNEKVRAQWNYSLDRKKDYEQHCLCSSAIIHPSVSETLKEKNWNTHTTEESITL